LGARNQRFATAWVISPVTESSPTDREIHFAREARRKGIAAVSDHFHNRSSNSSCSVWRNAGPALFQNERLLILGDEFQQFAVSPVAGFVDRLGEKFVSNLPCM